ncbi:MAG TPA: homoserine O-succinyltransferase [Caulobacteraceae bacterium]|jgi:homoserine O-succinyltransferase
MADGAGHFPQAQVELHIGLVNNMPDGAFLATERQFSTLLQTAGGAATIRLHRFFLPEIERGEAVAAQLRRRYRSAERLFEGRLDGVIVTGSEPRAPNIEDEVYWPSFRRLVDWAELNTRSTLWSCLAAHAAVLHLHGVRRRPLEQKLSGVFRRTRVSAEGARRGLALGAPVPHSRLNTLPQAELARRGYEVLAEIEGGDLDAFTLDAGSRFVFVQGHPEYEADTLRLEYERDLNRSLRGRLPEPPRPPANYDGRASWRQSAVGFYAAWLGELGSAAALHSAA